MIRPSIAEPMSSVLVESLHGDPRESSRRDDELHWACRLSGDSPPHQEFDLCESQ